MWPDPGIEPRTSDLRVNCPTDCATRPGHIRWKNLIIETEKSEQTMFAQSSLLNIKVIFNCVCCEAFLRIATQNWTRQNCCSY